METIESVEGRNGIGKSTILLEIAESIMQKEAHTEGFIEGYEKAMEDMKRPLLIEIIRPSEIPINPFNTPLPVRPFVPSPLKPYNIPPRKPYDPFIKPKPFELFPKRKHWHCNRCGGNHHPDCGCPNHWRF
jgi:hypothetical protein